MIRKEDMLVSSTLFYLVFLALASAFLMPIATQSVSVPTQEAIRSGDMNLGSYLELFGWIIGSTITSVVGEGMFPAPIALLLLLWPIVNVLAFVIWLRGD